MDRKTADTIFSILSGHYSDAWAKDRYFGPPFEVLITTILSAQTTDRAVDSVRGNLFSRFPTPAALATANPMEVEEIIRTTGFYHAKTRNIIRAAQALEERFGGRVPDRMEDLLTLPGVGRKTANIVLYHAFSRNEGVAVDTHVFRLAGRIGFSDGRDAESIEKDLIALFSHEKWGMLTDILISHGRAICTARNPACPVCPIRNYCRFYSTDYQPSHPGS
jgi:endonuclease-3